MAVGERSSSRLRFGARATPPSWQLAQRSANSFAPKPASAAFPDEGIDLERYIEGLEFTLIKRSLERTQGNKVQAARLLNLKRTTLIEKLKRLERTQPGH